MKFTFFPFDEILRVISITQFMIFSVEIRYFISHLSHQLEVFNKSNIFHSAHLRNLQSSICWDEIYHISMISENTRLIIQRERELRIMVSLECDDKFMTCCIFCLIAFMSLKVINFDTFMFLFFVNCHGRRASSSDFYFMMANANFPAHDTQKLFTFLITCIIY